MKIHTLDINALEWRDKVNGNSYFAGEIIVNMGMKRSERCFFMPFQYGYGSQYENEAINVLFNEKIIDEKLTWPHQLREKYGTLVRSFIRRGCLKRELKMYNTHANGGY